MKMVPTKMPIAIARNDQIRFPPPVMLISPVASVAIWALLMNQRGPMWLTRPCRSFSGT